MYFAWRGKELIVCAQLMLRNFVAQGKVRGSSANRGDTEKD
jgi:hypothetical protein